MNHWTNLDRAAHWLGCGNWEQITANPSYWLTQAQTRFQLTPEQLDTLTFSLKVVLDASAINQVA